MSLTRVPTARQVAFDAIPLSVQQRTDLGSGPKRLYGALNSAANQEQEPTYEELAERLGCSARSIVRWVQRLVAAGLIAVKRRGLTLPNLFRLLGDVISGGARRTTTRVTDSRAAGDDLLKERTKAGKKLLPGHPIHGFSALHLPGGP